MNVFLLHKKMKTPLSSLRPTSLCFFPPDGIHLFGAQCFPFALSLSLCQWSSRKVQCLARLDVFLIGWFIHLSGPARWVQLRCCGEIEVGGGKNFPLCNKFHMTRFTLCLSLSENTMYFLVNLPRFVCSVSEHSFFVVVDRLENI